MKKCCWHHIIKNLDLKIMKALLLQLINYANSQLKRKVSYIMMKYYLFIQLNQHKVLRIAIFCR